MGRVRERESKTAEFAHPLGTVILPFFLVLLGVENIPGYILGAHTKSRGHVSSSPLLTRCTWTCLSSSMPTTQCTWSRSLFVFHPRNVHGISAAAPVFLFTLGTRCICCYFFILSVRLPSSMPPTTICQRGYLIPYPRKWHYSVLLSKEIQFLPLRFPLLSFVKFPKFVHTLITFVQWWQNAY